MSLRQPQPGVSKWTDKILRGDWFDVLLGPLTALVGEPVVATLFGGTVLVALWSWTGSLTVPATWLVLFAGIVFASAPPSVAVVGFAAVVIALAIGLYGVIAGGN